jgi:membrane-associated phospholipid phosphatase
VTGVLLAGWLGSEALLKKTLAPEHCRWCESNPIDEFGRGLRGAPDQLLLYDSLSNLDDFALVPAAMIGLELYLAGSSDFLEAVPIDLLIIAQATLTAMALNQGVKFLVARERPFVHALSEGEKPLTKLPDDNNLSFFSGHSSFAFALTVATGTVARLRGYRYAWLVWAIGLPLAATVPLLRMAADRHYLTDVLTGSVVGGLIGYGLPTLFHGREASVEGVQVQLVPAPNGFAVTGIF